MTKEICTRQALQRKQTGEQRKALLNTRHPRDYLSKWDNRRASDKGLREFSRGHDCSQFGGWDLVIQQIFTKHLCSSPILGSEDTAADKQDQHSPCPYGAVIQVTERSHRYIKNKTM